MIDINSLKLEIDNIKKSKKGEFSAPHKPLLILFILSKIYINPKIKNAFYFDGLKNELTFLLKNFGWSYGVQKPQYPFVFLGSSPNLWITSIKKQDLKDQNNPMLGELYNQFGKLPDDLFDYLIKEKNSLKEIIEYVLLKNWPEDIHSDILNALGLNLDLKYEVKRNPKFAKDVMDAYMCKCAICGQSIRISDVLVGIDACHVKALQYGGNDLITNGIALCKFHHWTLDRGAIGINENFKLEVSDSINGEKVEEHLIKYENTQIFIPRRMINQLDNSNIKWHYEHIFNKKN